MGTGSSAVQDFLRGRSGSGGGDRAGGRFLPYLILGDGESKIVRFLTDLVDSGCKVAKFYEFVIDKNGKYQNFVVAPSFYAKDPNWNGEDWVLKYGGKTKVWQSTELVDPTPRERMVGLAVEREEIPTEVNGRRVLATQDKLVQFGNDKVFDARNFLIVKQTRNFWKSLQTYYDEFGTICDRDYKISRTGTGKDVHYTIIPKTPDPDWNNDGSSLAALQARYGYGTGADMDGNPLTPESEDRFLYCSQTLSQWLENQASEERARDALVGNGTPPLNGTSPAPGWAVGKDDEPTASPVPAPAPANSDVSSLRARLERHR